MHSGTLFYRVNVLATEGFAPHIHALCLCAMRGGIAECPFLKYTTQ